MKISRAVFLFLIFAGCSVPMWSQDPDWIPCGGENDACRIATTDVVTVRYGSSDSFSLLEVEGGSVDCNNHVFGDPAPGRGKSCAYRRQEADKRTWSRCAMENQLCPVPAGLPRYVRYGSGQRWTIKPASGTFPCNNDAFDDVAPGMEKECDVSSVLPLSAKSSGVFRDCGSEYAACALPNDSGTKIVRFGDGDKRWRYMTVSVPSLPCSLDTFQYDPANGIRKFCQIASFPTIEHVSGRWVEVGSNRGGGSLHVDVTSGIEGSRSKAVSETFKEELTTTFEGGPKVFKAGLEIKLGHETSTAVTEVLSRSQSLTKGLDCPAGKPNSALYQWAVDVDESCFTSVMGCRSTINTFKTMCTADLPDGVVPTIQPGMCADTACTVQKSGTK